MDQKEHGQHYYNTDNRYIFGSGKAKTQAQENFGQATKGYQQFVIGEVPRHYP